MKMLASLFVALFFYVRADILIWQRIFEVGELWHYAGIYHAGWYQMLWGLMVLGCLVFSRWRERLFYSIALYLLAFNGTNDILYYWLDGRNIPARLEWLDSHHLILFSPVTSDSLLLNCIIWIAAIVAIYRMILR